MTHAQYLRIERLAGGQKASRASFVRATHKLLGRNGRSSNCRKLRHAWIRRGLKLYTKAHKLTQNY